VGVLAHRFGSRDGQSVGEYAHPTNCRANLRTGAGCPRTVSAFTPSLMYSGERVGVRGRLARCVRCRFASHRVFSAPYGGVGDRHRRNTDLRNCIHNPTLSPQFAGAAEDRSRWRKGVQAGRSGRPSFVGREKQRAGKTERWVCLSRPSHSRGRHGSAPATFARAYKPRDRSSGSGQGPAFSPTRHLPPSHRRIAGSGMWKTNDCPLQRRVRGGFSPPSQRPRVKTHGIPNRTVLQKLRPPPTEFIPDHFADRLAAPALWRMVAQAAMFFAS
jgi:hypothetical protein